MELTFHGRVVEWRGPSPYFFVPLPADEVPHVRDIAPVATYGWGVVPVRATVGDESFDTSLIPKDGGYLLPLKDAVRRPLGIDEGDAVAVRMEVRPRP